MGAERTSSYYDQMYIDCEDYHKEDIKESVYYPIWKEAISWISPTEKIVDLGCGSGQFAKLCLLKNRNYIYGCDFSAEAITLSKKHNPDKEYMFEDRCLLNPLTYMNMPDYDIACIFEVLEHIERDRDILNSVKPGKRIILSVPDFWDTSHVRVFENVEQIIERYKDIVDIKNIYTYTFESGSRIFLCNSLKL